jgi:antitoxin component YwqK of YwqJK toxin-antitoxin module
LGLPGIARIKKLYHEKGFWGYLYRRLLRVLQSEYLKFVRQKKSIKMSEPSPSGLEPDTVTLYDAENRITYIGQMSANMKHGTGCEYYPTLASDLIPKAKGNFLNNLPSDPNFSFYNPQGLLQSLGHVTAGQKNGLNQEFHPNGSLRCTANFSSNKISQDFCTIHRSNNSIEYQGSISNGLYNGRGSYYNDSNNLISKGTYLNGLLNGPDCEFYHENCQKMYHGEMKGNLFDGSGESFH